MTINELVENVLHELNAFIITQFDQAIDFLQVAELSDERNDLIQYTLDYIDYALDEKISTDTQKIEFLKAVQRKLEKYFQFGDAINDKYRNNIKTYYLNPEKYLASDHNNDLTLIFDAFKSEVNENINKIQQNAINAFDRENYKLKKIKLPYTNGTLQNAITQLNEDKKAILAFIQTSAPLLTAPKDIRGSLLTLLDYDIGSMKSSMLWDVLGHVLCNLDDHLKAQLRFKDLFKNEESFNIVCDLFKSKGIIDPDKNTMGLIVPGSINKHTTASHIAIAEVLNKLKLLSNKYTLKEQVRIMVNTFNMNKSNSSLTKKSPYHEKMVELAYSVLLELRNI